MTGGGGADATARLRFEGARWFAGGSGDCELALLPAPDLFQHSGVQARTGADLRPPTGAPARRLADGKHGFHFAGRGEIGGQIFLGMARQRRRDVRREYVRRRCPDRSRRAPAFRIAADADDSLLRRAIRIARRTARRRSRNRFRCNDAQAQSFAEGDVVAAKIVHLSVEGDAQAAGVPVRTALELQTVPRQPRSRP